MPRMSPDPADKIVLGIRARCKGCDICVAVVKKPNPPPLDYTWELPEGWSWQRVGGESLFPYCGACMPLKPGG